MQKRNLRPLLVPFLLLGAFLISVLLLFSFRTDTRRFTELTTELFKNELLPNTLDMHYTIAYPQNYGIYSYEPTLPVYSHKQELASNAQLENYIQALSRIRPEKLDPEDAYTYALLTDYLETASLGTTFTYYNEPLSPGSGIQSQLPILLAEYTFRTKQDVEDYLALLEQTGDYFEGFIRYEQEKAEAGLFMADYSLEKVRLQCDTILSREALDAGSHFLQTTFEERLSELLSGDIINDKEYHHFIDTNNRLLSTVVLPAYETLSDALFLLQGSGTNEEGLSHYPKGKEYYEYLLQKSTGSHRNAEEVKDLLYAQFDKEYAAFQTFVKENSSLLTSEQLSPSAELFPLNTPENILQDLQTRMAEDFPTFPSSVDAVLPSCKVKTVSDSLEPFSAPAFYLTPPLDDSSNNVIYINEAECPAGLSLYTTLAHEGYPGHLYQSVYHQQHLQEEELNPVRELLWYGGYLEGWALYTEFISYDYAIDIIEDAGHADEAVIFTLEKYNRSLQLCLLSIIDIAIHYDGASPETITGLLSSFGISDPDSCRAIYEYIVEEPANYLKYYLGYLEILELKEKARTLWGAGYNDLRFHTFFLESGPSDFENLSIRLQQSETLKQEYALLPIISAKSGKINSNP